MYKERQIKVNANNYLHMVNINIPLSAEKLHP